jgi:hypothetical protein
MSRRARINIGGFRNPDRWMAEITYTTGRAVTVVKFEEIEDLDEIIEHGPDWCEIDQIVITLNRSPMALGTLEALEALARARRK